MIEWFTSLSDLQQVAVILLTLVGVYAVLTVRIAWQWTKGRL